MEIMAGINAMNQNLRKQLSFIARGFVVICQQGTGSGITKEGKRN